MSFSSPLLPERNSVPIECARVIRARLAAGEWSDALPGERALAMQLHVGRDTIRLALAELTKTGWISAADRGKRRKSLRQGQRQEQKKSAHLRIGLLSPFRLEQMSQQMLSEIDHVRSLLAEQRSSLEILNPAFLHQQHPQQALGLFTRDHPCDVWILHRANLEIQQYFQKQQIPCLIRGHAHEGVQLPYIDYDWKATARHAMAQLWRNGHRHVGIIMPADGLQGNLAALEGAREFCEPGVILSEIRESHTQPLRRTLVKWIDQSHGPTAFITLRPRQALTLLTWLGSIGRPVPSSHSIISLASEATFEHLVPRIASYSTPPQQFAKKVVKQLRLLASAQLPAVSHTLVMPDFHPAESIRKIP